MYSPFRNNEQYGNLRLIVHESGEKEFRRALKGERFDFARFWRASEAYMAARHAQGNRMALRMVEAEFGMDEQEVAMLNFNRVAEELLNPFSFSSTPEPVSLLAADIRAKGEEWIAEHMRVLAIRDEDIAGRSAQCLRRQKPQYEEKWRGALGR